MFKSSESGVNMLVNRKRIAALAMAFLGVAGSSAFATPVTFYFGGTITEVQDPFAHLNDRIQVGDVFSGSYTFILESLDSDMSNSVYAYYEDSIIAVDIAIGDEFVTHGPASFSAINLVNDPAGKTGIDIYTAAASVLLSEVSLTFGLQLADDDALFLQNDFLSTTPPDVALAEFRHFGLSSQPLGVHVNGELEFLSVVPEPATGILAIGLIFAWLGGRRTHLRYHPNFRRSGYSILLLVAPWAVAPRSAKADCGCMDLVFAIDMTGSMSTALARAYPKTFV